MIARVCVPYKGSWPRYKNVNASRALWDLLLLWESELCESGEDIFCEGCVLVEISVGCLRFSLRESKMQSSCALRDVFAGEDVWGNVGEVFQRERLELSRRFPPRWSGCALSMYSRYIPVGSYSI